MLTGSDIIVFCLGRRRLLRAGFLFFWLAVLVAGITPERLLGSDPAFPEPDPPFFLSAPSVAVFGLRPSLADVEEGLYDSGDPTDLEQLSLEYINRARANPQAEALFLALPNDPAILAAYGAFRVDTNLLIAQFADIQPSQPLAMNRFLLEAGRQHSRWMLSNRLQTHSEGALGAGQRLLNSGYAWDQGGGYGENIFAYANSVVYGHTAFDTDWGVGPGGMQAPPGHRLNIHGADFREAGIGVVVGNNGPVGPQLITQEFGVLIEGVPFVTGVAYYDFNGNQFYDPGEGISGVRVEIEGASNYAITSRSGGYAVPVAGSGSRWIRIGGEGFVESIQSIELSGSRNLKVDFVPTYAAPVIQGPSQVTAGASAEFRFSEVGGASRFELRESRRMAMTLEEGAENGPTNVLLSVNGDYPTIVEGVAAAGTRSFHLAHPSPARDQSLRLNWTLLPGTNASLNFASRLARATSRQVARTQVSKDGGASWTDLWSQPGTGEAGQRTFTPVSLSLSNYAGTEIQVRFLYALPTGAYYSDTDNNTGFFIDSISFTDTDRIEESAPVRIPGRERFEWAASEEGYLRLQVRGLLSDRELPWGPPFEVLAEAPPVPLALELSLPSDLADAWMGVRFRIVSGEPSLLTLEESESPSGPWRLQPSAVLQSEGEGAYRFLFSEPPSLPRFFRVRGE